LYTFLPFFPPCIPEGWSDPSLFFPRRFRLPSIRSFLFLFFFSLVHFPDAQIERGGFLFPKVVKGNSPLSSLFPFLGGMPFFFFFSFFSLSYDPLGLAQSSPILAPTGWRGSTSMEFFFRKWHNSSSVLGLPRGTIFFLFFFFFF